MEGVLPAGVSGDEMGEFQSPKGAARGSPGDGFSSCEE